MEKGKLYCCKFYVQLSQNSKYGIDDIGMLFSNEKIEISTIPKKEQVYFPQITNSIGLLKNRGEWIEICGIYIAKGEEEYITLGRFKPLNQFQLEIIEGKNQKAKSQLNKNDAAYYLFDNVSVVPIKKEESCACQNQTIRG